MIWVAILLYVLGAIAIIGLDDDASYGIRFFVAVALWPAMIAAATVSGLAKALRDQFHQFLKGVRS